MKLTSANVNKLMVGGSAATRVYLGATQIWDADAAGYFARIVAAGSTISDANRNAVAEFIIGCKADGIWNAIKASCILAAADTLAGALVPLKGTAPTNVGPFIADDYSRTLGLVGDGATKHLDSNRNNNADPQNSQHLAVWITEQPNPTASIAYAYAGTTGGLSGSSMIGRQGSVARRIVAQSRLDDAQYVLGGDAVTGFHGKSRSNADNFIVRVNGGNATRASISVAPRNQNVSVFAWGTGFNALNRISFYSIGENLNLALLDARLTTLMAAIT